MSNKSHTQSILVDVEFGENFDVKEVELTGNITYGNMGIGCYEFWGQKCNDVQMGYEVDGVNWDYDLYTKEENDIIELYVDKHQSKIEDELVTKVQKLQTPDY